MNIEPLKQYITKKGVRSYIETLALNALSDSVFLKEYGNFDFCMHRNQFSNVLNNPQPYDNQGNNMAYYQDVIIKISNTYNTYLYDKKAKYSDLKKTISSIEDKARQAEIDIEKIKNVSELISGEKVLQVYAEEFKTRSVSYKTEADKWQKYIYLSFIAISIVAVSFLFVNIIHIDFLKKYIAEDLLHYGYFGVIFIKVIILAALIQIVRFFYRNYNANKHLENQTLHKYDVLRALQGVYNTISVENKEARDELIKTGALTAFQSVESGYITTKEGAGGLDAGIYSALTNALRK